ncbi:MAG: LicD family protein [Limisphaerales bacterium]
MGELQNRLWYGNLNYMFWSWLAICASVVGMHVLAVTRWTSGLHLHHRRVCSVASVALVVWSSLWMADYTVHHRSNCALPAVIQESNHRCAVELTKAMQTVHSVHNVSWWVDYGSLLALERKSGIMPWDDDFDLGVADITADNLALMLRRALYPISISRVVVASVDMVQLYCGRTHADVFVWQARGSFLVNNHPTSVSQARLRTDILPAVPRRFLGLTDVMAPRHSIALAAAEYGPGWYTPRVTHRECLNGYWNYVRALSSTVVSFGTTAFAATAYIICT